MKERSLQAFPADFSFPNLSALLSNQAGVRKAFAPLGRSLVEIRQWFDRVDVMLRSNADAADIITLASSMAKIPGTSWEGRMFLEAAVVDAQAASESRRAQARLRSLWGITPIIGLPVGVKADRVLGVEAESLVMTTYYCTRNFDISLSHHISTIRATAPASEEAFYWLVLVWAILSYDVFFFYNDRGILPPREFTGRLHMGIRQEELALLRRAEKVLYTMPYGADFRTRKQAMSVSRFNFCIDCFDVGKFCFCNDDVWPSVFHTTAAYATAVLGWGLALREVPGSRRADFVVVDTDEIKPNYIAWTAGRNVRVLHVPNHAHFKGSSYLREAVERLTVSAPIELKLASGISNTEVLQLMRDCDLVVDQLIGGHFGLTALEAMASGKPVIVYIVNWETVIAPEECPFINANPDTIFNVLNELVADPTRLVEIGRQSRAYVEKHYSIPALANRLRKLYKDTAGIDFSRQLEERNAEITGNVI
jgi:hypothetical protein